MLDEDNDLVINQDMLDEDLVINQDMLDEDPVINQDMLDEDLVINLDMLDEALVIKTCLTKITVATEDELSKKEMRERENKPIVSAVHTYSIPYHCRIKIKKIHIFFVKLKI